MTKTRWTRIKGNALTALNFLVLAAITGTKFDNDEQICCEAYREGEDGEKWIIILNNAQKQNPKAKYVLFYDEKHQLLNTKNALYASILSIKAGNGMKHDVKMDTPIKEKVEKAIETVEVIIETYKEILDRIRRDNPKMSYAEAQQVASKEHKANQAA